MQKASLSERRMNYRIFVFDQEAGMMISGNSTLVGLPSAKYLDFCKESRKRAVMWKHQEVK